MYGMTNSGKIFSGELTNWLIYESVFNQSKFKMSVYYTYALYVGHATLLTHGQWRPILGE